MKLMMRKWQWLAGLLAAGLICATYLLAQNQTRLIGVDTQPIETAAVNPASPNEEETADSARLIEAVNAGDAQTALEILHAYGVAEDTVLAMATHLGKSPVRVELKEPFLKASVAVLSLTDPAIKVQARLQAVAALGYERPVLIASKLETKSIARYDANLSQCPLTPIAVLNVKLNDPCFIRFFLWYDRCAEHLHSVALNGDKLNNAKLEVESYDQADRTLNALFQLIKARKPDAFVWLGVVKEDDRTDEPWLKAMTFKPDGLQISNLRQFHSPFAETRQRYAKIVGADTPMMVAGFYGYMAALQEKGKRLSAALKNKDSQARQAAEAEATAELGSVGAVAGQDLVREEANLQSLGYRGLSTQWLLLTSLANSGKAAGIDKSDLLDPRAGLLETCYLEKDYARLSSLAAEMISNSAPGDMNWTVGKLYDGMVLLSQTPPKTSEASAVLDEVLAFDFKNRPGRDHYIIGAVKWRMYAASLSGDTKKGRELVQWVQNREFRNDLKSAFLKKYADILTQPTTTSK
jgi:hypothetical protein